MKKVLFISNVPVPYRMEFFRQLSKYVELTVIFEANSGKFQYNYDLNAVGFRIIFANINGKKRQHVYIKEIKRDYDYIIMADWLHSFIPITYLKIRKIPYYVEVDGAILHDDNFLKKAYKTFLLKEAKGYFSTSDSADKYFFRYGAKKDEIIRYPFSSVVDLDILNEQPDNQEKNSLKKQLGLDISKKMIIGVGRYIHRKGFDILISAMKYFGEMCELVLVGGEPTEEYKKLISLENIDNVHFVSFIKKEELFKYYRAADVFVLPTREEVWGLVINEAMSQGLPIITTDNCVAGAEMVVNGENGYIFHVDDVKGLTECLLNVLQDEDNRKKLCNGSLKKIKQYTIEKMVAIHKDFFIHNLGERFE